jgi:hypothetical protein
MKQDIKMLDVLSFFKEVGELSYCVVKMSDQFPLYRTGDDVDIFCYSVDEMTKKLLSWGDKYLDNGFQIKVKDVYRKQHVHIDFLKNSALQFRFDLYGRLPDYKKAYVKSALFESVIENSQPVDFQDDAQIISVNRPSEIDDMLIRYLEFIEWYDVRPDKIKHLEFILKCSNEIDKMRFLEKMHHYTKMPPIHVPEKPKVSHFSAIVQFIKDHLP